MKEDISTWFPPLVGHSLEMAIVAINLYKDVGKRPSEEGAGAGDEEAGAGVGLGLEGGRIGDDAFNRRRRGKAAAVNRAMEKGEKEERGGWGSDAAPSDEGSDWLDEMPDAGFVEQSGYVCDQMCTNRSSSTRCSSTCESAGEGRGRETSGVSRRDETGRDESSRGFVPW